MDVLHDGLVAILIDDPEVNIAEDVGPIVLLNFFNYKFHGVVQLLHQFPLGHSNLTRNRGTPDMLAETTPKAVDRWVDQLFQFAQSEFTTSVSPLTNEVVIMQSRRNFQVVMSPCERGVDAFMHSCPS